MASVFATPSLRTSELPRLTFETSPRSPQPSLHVGDVAVARRWILGCAPFMLLVSPANAVALLESAAPVLNTGRSFTLLPGPPPLPVTVPRRKLEQSFAVLLMRSGYDVADSLDFTAMDTFQKQFWLQRQSEWEGYRQQYSPLTVTQVQLMLSQY